MSESFDFTEAISREEMLVMAANNRELQAALQFILKGRVNIVNKKTIQNIIVDPEAYLDKMLKQICYMYQLEEQEVLSEAINRVEEIFIANG
jgi:hypothetical protein